MDIMPVHVSMYVAMQWHGDSTVSHFFANPRNAPYAACGQIRFNLTICELCRWVGVGGDIHKYVPQTQYLTL